MQFKVSHRAASALLRAASSDALASASASLLLLAVAWAAWANASSHKETSGWEEHTFFAAASTLPLSGLGIEGEEAVE
jgi:hypothetical protein